MKIPVWVEPDGQMARLGRHMWSVPRLFALTKDFEAHDVPLDFLDVHTRYNRLTPREMVMHFNAVNNADLSFPIILDEDGEIMDGWHRVMKAMLLGEKTIKVVRFDENPSPCKISDDD